jgi:hypothetical protein
LFEKVVKMGRKKIKAPPFVMVNKALLHDPVWRKLSSSAKIVYIYLRAKFNTKTLNVVTLTYSEMKDMMSPVTLSKAFKDLQAAGFIEKVERGGLIGCGGVATKYRFIGQYGFFYYEGRKI